MTVCAFVLMLSHFNKLTILYIIMVTVAPSPGQDSDFHNKKCNSKAHVRPTEGNVLFTITLDSTKGMRTLKHNTHVIAGHITPKACALICCFHSSVEAFHNILDPVWL